MHHVRKMNETHLSPAIFDLERLLDHGCHQFVVGGDLRPPSGDVIHLDVMMPMTLIIVVGRRF